MIFIGMKKKFLNEDGSVNIERINKLPYEEYMDAMGKLTETQFEEYLSKSPIIESVEMVKPVWVNYTIEEEINKGGVEASDFLNEMQRKYINKG